MTSPGPLRVATRRSALARTQSTQAGQALAAVIGSQVELVEVVTPGDVDRSPLAQMGGTGVFVTAVRQAVVDGRADVAVHSLKDLPTSPDDRLVLAAVPARQDPRDVLVTRAGVPIAGLPIGARVGTGSPRRRALLLAERPDLWVVDIRGNVDTRVARVLGDGQVEPDLDAVVLAAAGLIRLGRHDVPQHYLDPTTFVPAPGQGALALEVAVGSPWGAAAEALDDATTRAAVTAERSLLAHLSVGCSAPLGAHGKVDPDAGTVHLRAVLAGADGTLHRRTSLASINDAHVLGRDLAAALLGDIRIAAQTPSPPTAKGEPIP